MDAVLERALKLACLVRDSNEAASWRTAWNSLRDVQLDSQDMMALPDQPVSLVAIIKGIYFDNPAQSRPMLFPLLVGQSLQTDIADIKASLADRPEVWQAYQRFISGLELITLIVTLLRKAGSGHPHGHFLYSLPATPWKRLSSRSELPWNMGEFLIPDNAPDAVFVGLNRNVPSIAPRVAAALNDLIVAIKSGVVWKQLKQSYDTIAQRINLIAEADRAKAQFEREFNAINQVNVSQPELYDKAEEIAKRVYARRGARIQAYVNSFWEYERLVERIYWVISQVVMHEVISCITSSVPQQLQQVTLGYGSNGLLTALALTSAQTLRIGQLVHISLPEADNVFDGIYQVEHLCEKYQIAIGNRILLRVRCLWYCHLETVLKVTEAGVKPIFMPSEMEQTDYQFTMTAPNGETIHLRLGDPLLTFEFTRTTYLP